MENYGLNNNTEMCVEHISTTRSEKLLATKSRKCDRLLSHPIIP